MVDNEIAHQNFNEEEGVYHLRLFIFINEFINI